MLDAPFWQDTGIFWTDRPAWTSDEDASPGASSLGLVALEVTTRSDTLIAVNPVTVGFVSPAPGMVVMTVVVADALPMTAFIKDYEQFIESLVLADVVGLGVLQEEAASGYVVQQAVDFVPVSITPRDPYVFTLVTLTPGAIPLSIGAAGENLYGVLQVIQADPLVLAVEGQFYYFEITSSLPLDFLSSAMEVGPFTVVADSLTLVDSLEMVAALYDAPPVSHCLFPADQLDMSMIPGEPETLWGSLIEAPEWAVYADFAAPVQRSSFVFDQEEVFPLGVVLPAAGVAVDVSASPDLLLMTADATLDPDISASPNIPADALGIGLTFLSVLTSRSEGFAQEAAFPLALATPDPVYAGRVYTEGARLATPVTRSLTLSTPVNLVPSFEELQ